MKAILMIMLLMCSILTSAIASETDTTLTVGQAYQGGVITKISVCGDFAVVKKDGLSYSFPVSDGAIIDDYYLINSVVVRDGEVVMATGDCPLWVAVLVIAIIVIAVVGLLLWIFH